MGSEMCIRDSYSFYFIFQVSNGKNVAEINDKKSNELAINEGKKSTGIKIPTRIDFEKSGLGNNNKPTVKPIIIERYAFFSLIFLS